MKAYTKYIENVNGYTDVYLTVTATQKVAGANLASEMKKLPFLTEHTNYLSRILEKYKQIYGLASHILSKNGLGGKVLVIIMGDKGLTGDLYPRIAKLAKSQVGTYSEKILVGPEGLKYLDEEDIKINGSFNTTQFDEIFNTLYQKFVSELKSIDIIYAEPKTLISIQPVLTNILSISSSESLADNLKTTGLPVLTSTKSEMTMALVREILITGLYASMLKAAISELSARTIAMESAAAKTQQIIKKLKFGYFKDRRLFTTQKQLESFVVLKRT